MNKFFKVSTFSIIVCSSLQTFAAQRHLVPMVTEVRVARPDFATTREFERYVQRPTPGEIVLFRARRYQAWEQEQQYVNYRNIILHNAPATLPLLLQIEGGVFLGVIDPSGELFGAFKNLVTSSSANAAFMMKILKFLATLNPEVDRRFEVVADILTQCCEPEREVVARPAVGTILGVAEQLGSRR